MPPWTPETPYVAQLFEHENGEPVELFYKTSEQLEQEIAKQKLTGLYRRISAAHGPTEDRNEWQGIEDWKRGY